MGLRLLVTPPPLVVAVAAVAAGGVGATFPRCRSWVVLDAVVRAEVPATVLDAVVRAAVPVSAFE